MYLVNKAQEEIKEINQKTLFQKNEIKKRYLERYNENFQRLRDQFIETYNSHLNNALSRLLLYTKEKVLNLKGLLIKELKTEIINSIKDKIENDYSDYICYLIDSMKNIGHFLDKIPQCVIILNHKDFEYFNKNFKEIQNIFKNQAGITQNSTDFLGGFKVISSNEEIVYDYSLNNLIDKNNTLIEIEFSKTFDVSEIKNIQDNFEKFIKSKKSTIEEYLKEYDRI